MKGLFPKIVLLDGSIFALVIFSILTLGYLLIGDANPLVWLIAFGGGLFALAFLTYFSLQRRVIQPLDEIQSGTDAIAQGELDYRLQVNSGDEVESLAHAFNVHEDGLRALVLLQVLQVLVKLDVRFVADADVVAEAGLTLDRALSHQGERHVAALREQGDWP